MAIKKVFGQHYKEKIILTIIPCIYNLSSSNMRPIKYNKSKKPPAFISNLYRILEDQSNHAYIKWREDGESFIILNIARFSDVVLPKYYKHSNYSSFVRQLNMYHFSKIRTELEGEHIFRNGQFVQNSLENLKNIRRREVTNTKNSNILSIAQAISSQIMDQSNELSGNAINEETQNNHSNQLIEVAAPKGEHGFFLEPFFDHLNFPQLENLKLHPSAQQFIDQSDKIPLLLPLKPQTKYFPLKTKVQELKLSQLQLQQVCVGLYKQNEYLTSENKRLQERLKSEFKKKQQILNQIIKYVINFLSEWNTGSGDLQEDLDLTHARQHVISDDESSSQVILDSYDLLDKKSSFAKTKKQTRQQPSTEQKGFAFSKYAKNEKKILLTLLKEIEKSYNEKFFFTQTYSSHHPTENKGQHSDYYSQANYGSSSPNNFMMSMLLKFIESNNLVEVIKRFSLLINLERNKKSRSFTVVNCMKDLKERLQLKELQKNKFSLGMNVEKEKGNKFLEPQGFEHLAYKERFLENEKQTIKQMEKELALITKPKSKTNKMSLFDHDLFDSSDHESSLLSFIPQKIYEIEKREKDDMQTFHKGFREKEQFGNMEDLQSRRKTNASNFVFSNI